MSGLESIAPLTNEQRDALTERLVGGPPAWLMRQVHRFGRGRLSLFEAKHFAQLAYLTRHTHPGHIVQDEIGVNRKLTEVTSSLEDGSADLSCLSLWGTSGQLSDDQRLRLYTAIRMLPYAQRRVVWARYRRGLSSREIAKHFGFKSNGSVASVCGNALRTLELMLTGELGDRNVTKHVLRFWAWERARRGTHPEAATLAEHVRQQGWTEVGEVAEHLDVHTATLRRLFRQGWRGVPRKGNV